MPPALSDYDSEEGFDVLDSIEAGEVDQSAPCFQPRVRQDILRQRSSTVSDSQEHSPDAEPRSHSNTALRSRSTRRKTPAILQGMRLDNIISTPDAEEGRLSKDTSPISSILASSYRTRNQMRGSQKSHLCYDQKYHPMDDVIRPSQAVKQKSKHGVLVLGSDETLFSSFDDGNHSESDTELEDDQPKKTKRKSTSVRPPPQPSRRTSRQVNKTPIYDMKIHPQDAELDIMSISSQSEGPARKRRRCGSNAHEGDSDEERDAGADAYYSIIADSETIFISEDSTMSTMSQDPTSEANVEPPNTVHMRPPEGSGKMNEHGLGATQSNTGFIIHEESLLEQLAREAAAADPVEYYDDDKENGELSTDLEASLDPFDGIDIRPTTTMNSAQIQIQGESFDECDLTGDAPESAELEAFSIISSGVLHLDGAGDSLSVATPNDLELEQQEEGMQDTKASSSSS